MSPANLISPRRGLIITVLLGLIGAGLVMLATVFAAPTGTSTPSAVAIAIVPSAPWQAMPTRERPALTPTLEPTLEPESDLARLQRALLTANLAEAQQAWETLEHSDLGATAAGQVAGARLALLSHDLDAAEQRAARALELASAASPAESAFAWSMLGVIHNRRGEHTESEAAFTHARDLDPALEPQLFEDRWHNAVRGGDRELLAQLAGSYSIHHPDSPLEPYYRASALLADDHPLLALGVLHAALTAQPEAPALLWLTLSDIYLALDSFSDAAIALEVTASKVAQGDTSLLLVTDDPMTQLSTKLAHAYLATDRCAEAEGLYLRLAVSDPELADPLEQAILCQTPTPTPTHWILRLQSTATPAAQP